MTDDLPRAVWSGSFDIMGVTLYCHVLEDGRRIIEQGSFHRFMDAMADGVPMTDDTGLMAFLRWQRGR